MRGISIEERAITLAQYIIDSKDTVRGAAKKFGISKSTVHKGLAERLIKINPILASGRFEKPNLKISVYKNRRGKM